MTQGQVKRHRFVEDAGFVAAIVVAVLYGLGEVAALLGARLGPHDPDHGFPWGVLILNGMLVLPKVLGKASAGKVWEAISTRVGGGS